jgi:hypothetical protein
MHKLEVLNFLKDAYWSASSRSAARLIEEKFHEVRRSLQLLAIDTYPDLEKPPLYEYGLDVQVENEGYNGKLPTYF